jgi:hypothetical protein
VSAPQSNAADALASQILAYRAQALGGTFSEEHSSGSNRIRLRCPARMGHPLIGFNVKRGVCDCIPLRNQNIRLIRANKQLP